MKNKTAEEILEILDCIYHDNSGNQIVYLESALMAMKEYAQSVAEDLRERIAESDVLLDNYYRFRFSNTDKEVIRNTEITLP